MTLGQPMTTSILLRSPSPSPSPASIPLPALQSDLSSSSSSSASGSCLDLHRSSSAPSTRRIRFAPLPDPRRDLLFEPHDPSPDDPQLDGKSPPQTLPTPTDLPDNVVVLSPSVSPVSSLSSARSTPTIRISPRSKNSLKSSSKLLRPFSFLRRSSSPGQSPLSRSVSLPGSCNTTSLASSTSLPNSPSSLSARLPRFSTEDILTLGTKSLFRSRSGSRSSPRPLRTSSPPPRSLDSSKSLYRSASTGSGQGMKLGSGKRDLGEGSSQPHSPAAIAGSGSKKRRASSSALTPGAGGGRHTSVRMVANDSHPSTAPTSPVTFPKRHVKMLNGRVYGAKRIAAQTLANPFANVRDEPEFVEWGYGGMGSVHASAGIANDMWKGLQRSERGGALFAGSSFGLSYSESTRSSAGAAGGGRGSGARPPIARRKMSDNVPECGMGNLGVAADEDDGSGMGWVKRRRAEKEAKARLEQAAKEKSPEGRKSGDSMDASMYASTVSTACASVASTVVTTPATSPLTSRSPSLVDLNLSSSPLEPRDSHATIPSEQPESPAHPGCPLKEDREHILRAVRLSPDISDLSHKRSHTATHGRTPSLSHTLSQIDKDTNNEGSEQIVPLSPVDTEETTASTSSLDDEEQSRGSDDGEADDDEEDIQEIGRRTALGAGVEKISQHVDVKAR